MLSRAIIVTVLAGGTAIASASSTRSPASHLLALSPTEHAPACATYHGRVPIGNRAHIYYLDQNCDAEGAYQYLAPFSWSAGRLLWIGNSVPDEDLSTAMPILGHQAVNEIVFSAIPAGPQPDVILDLGRDGQLVQVAHDGLIDRPEWTMKEIVAISAKPTKTPSIQQTILGDFEPQPVSQRDIDRVSEHLRGIRFSPLISTLLASVSEKNIRKDVRYLSGEDQSGASSNSERWVSRHSMSEGGEKASNWLLQRFRMYGFACQQHRFLPHFAPMIECELPGTGEQEGLNGNETVVIGAHFDSRGTFGSPISGGADDDGSGTALLLALARNIYEHRLTFSRKLIIAAYAGEEQGLLGSAWHAQHLKDRNEDVVMMLQVDMIGYRVPGEPLQMARPDIIGLPEAAWLVGNLSTVYCPELQVGYTPACCSDHQSFVAHGYASTWVFERNGPIRDPCYHQSCDMSSRPGYDFEQIHAITRVVFALVLEITGFSL